MAHEKSIYIKGARVHNLKNIEVEIPHEKLVVVTGLSGSGKSTLAFDTIFAEGQRRYVESLSAYARQFLGKISKPDVDIITGIAPAIAIEQKVNTRNPRSTVGTTTEIYDYLKLLYARIGHTFSPVSGQEVRCYSVDDVAAYIQQQGEGGRGAAHAGQGAGDHRETHAAALRRPDARLDEGRNAAHRGYPAPGRRKDPGGGDPRGHRPGTHRRRRRYADPHAGLRSPGVLLRRGDLHGHHRQGRHGVLVALRGRRHPVRAPLGTPFQLQQPAGGMSPVRGVRQGDRHRRRPGDPRQEQDHLRGRRGLLARRDDAQVEGAAGGERLQVRFPDPYAVP